MLRAAAAVVIAATMLFGCSHRSSDRFAPSTVSGDEAQLPLPGPEEFAVYQTAIDSVAALYEIGDVADFLTARDSLRMQIDALITTYPALRFDGEFQQVLSGLAELDSVMLYSPDTDPFNEVDSLALSLGQWPDLDTTAVADPTPALDDSLFPHISNDRIDFWLRYFTGPGKERFGRVLYRMQLYRPLIDGILSELELPHELICVAMIESGFNLKARSRARAVGPWQFIRGTARLYGMRVNWWFDERRDIVASTYAAGNYLKDLYSIWQSWPLALAGYNCGEYRVARAVARHKTTNFWKLRLPRQTERYVPKFLAALYILRDPEKYGFTIPDVEPVKFDEVTIKDATDLKLIARSAGTTVDVIKDLNPSLLRWATPPKMEITVKVPVGSGDACRVELDKIPPGERITWRKHRIRTGETLSVIARRYGTSTSELKRLNGIRNAHRIRAGRYLIVPVPVGTAEVASSKPQYKTKHRTINKKALDAYAKRYEPPANHKQVVYIVKDRDTLGEIAEVFRTSAKRIRYWNNLAYRSYIYPGQRLVIYVPDSFDVANLPGVSVNKPNSNEYVKRSYVVRKGDTIYSISKRFNVRMSDILAWNNVSRKARIYPGQTLEVWQKR